MVHALLRKSHFHLRECKGASQEAANMTDETRGKHNRCCLYKLPFVRRDAGSLMRACRLPRSSDGMFNLQSRCFFLGPLTSCVVALQTALLMADPVMLCCAAAIRSVKDCPDMLRWRRWRWWMRRQAE